MSELLDDLQQRTGLDIPIHVDGASGGFIAPFLDPDLEWDFRVPRVRSINVSGHKYGLVYPGVGWAIWRDAEALPEDLIFWVNYLGDEMPTFALNFSRPGSQVVAQYYNFLRLGFEGYRRVQQYARDVAVYTANAIEKLGPFELLTRGDELPVFAFKLKDEVKNFTVFDVSAALRERGWQVPAYTFPKNREDLAALRVVVRRGFTFDVADMLLDDLRKQLTQAGEAVRSRWRGGPGRAASITDDAGAAGAAVLLSDERPEGLRERRTSRRRRRGGRTTGDAIESARPSSLTREQEYPAPCGPSSSSSSSAWSPAGRPAC